MQKINAESADSSRSSGGADQITRSVAEMTRMMETIKKLSALFPSQVSAKTTPPAASQTSERNFTTKTTHSDRDGKNSEFVKRHEILKTYVGKKYPS